MFQNFYFLRILTLFKNYFSLRSKRHQSQFLVNSFSALLIGLLIIVSSGLVIGQTTILDVDFEDSPDLSSESSADAIYQSTSNSACSVGNRWEVLAASASTSSYNCATCVGMAASINDAFSSGCNNTYEDYTLNVGSFNTSQTSVVVKFDWGMHDSDSDPYATFYMQLWNKTDNVQEGIDLVDPAPTTFGSIATLTGSYNETLTVTPGKDYELRFVWDTENLYFSGMDNYAQIDNIKVEETCTSPTTVAATLDEANCGAGTYDLTGLEVTDLGQSTTVDLLINGVVDQTISSTGAITSANLLNIAAGTNTIIALDTDCGVVTLGSYTGCVNDECSEAVDIMGVCAAGDLSVAGDETNTANGTWLGFSVGSGNGVYTCGGSYNSNYRFTDETDLWYQMDIPDGADEFTVSFSGLTDRVMVVPYYGACGSLTRFPLTTSGNVDISTGEPFAVPDGSNEATITFSDNGGTTISGNAGPFYIQILAATSAPSPGNSNCSNIVFPSFTDICGSAPQANDACGDAIDVTTNFGGGAASIGDLNAASAEGGDEVDCALAATGGGDLWYKINYPTTGGPYLTEVTINGTTGQQVIAAITNVTEACGGYDPVNDPDDRDGCELLTFASPATTTFGDITSTAGQNRELQVIGVGSVDPITVSALIVSQNNTCSITNETFPLGFTFNCTSPCDPAKLVDFNYASASNVDGETDPDLWYVFDPFFGTDAFGHNVYSTSADINVTGLNSGEQLTIMLYKRRSSASDQNCLDFANDYLNTLMITSNGMTTIGCLDEIHGTSATSDGYIIRILQSAGATTASPTVTVTPGPIGPFNNSCVNIWDGSGPTNLGSNGPGDNLEHNYNAYYILDGETRSGDFTGATDCDSEIANADCNGVARTEAFEINDKDLWYIMTVPSNNCGTTGLTESTVVDNMDITFNSGSSFEDGYIYIYDDCGTANLLECRSAGLDGAGETWNVGGLTQGNDYLIRVKPNDATTPYDWDFDLTVDNGVARPCNDKKGDAHALTIESCPDYDNLVTWTMKGADDEEDFSNYDVWFKFTTPATPNGGPYFNADKQWVTVFFEGVSNHGYRLRLYQAGGTAIASGADEYTTSGTGDRVWCKYGHLEPNTEYVIRLEVTGESETHVNTTDIDYKIEINASPAITEPLTCGENASPATATLCGSCGDVAWSIPTQLNEVTPVTQTLCEEWYKIDLPVGTPDDMYWVAEVRGFDQVLDFELRSQFLSESSANEGGADDFDHPCSSRSLEPDADFISSVAVDYEVTSGGSYNYVGGEIGSSSCEDLSGGEPHGGGFKKIYKNLNGPITGSKDYYFIRVFMDPDDINFVDCSQNGTEAIQVCEVIFKGPYTTEVLANAGGIPDAGDCTEASISGNVFFDNYGDGTNGNAAGDGTGNDIAITGITVELYGPGCSPCTEVTDASGNYTFDGLADGDYTIKFIKGAYDSISGQNVGGDDTKDSDADPTTGETATITIGTTSKIVTNVDAGLYNYASVTGTLYQNYDADTGTGVDPAPNVTEDIIVEYCIDPSMLCTGANLTSMTYTVTTDASGYYEITEVVPGVIMSISSTTYTYEETSVINSQTLLASDGTQTEQDFAQTLLPVRLISFTAKETENENILEWVTSKEENTEKFIIERSINELSSFEAIGELNAAGFSNEIRDYRFVDKNYGSTSYYRLKVLDFDDHFEYSEIKVIKREKVSFGEVKIIPNPTHHSVSVQFDIPTNNEIEISVMDVLGRQVYQDVQGAVSGPVSINVDLDKQPAGIYFLTIRQGSIVHLERVVKN